MFCKVIKHALTEAQKPLCHMDPAFQWHYNTPTSALIAAIETIYQRLNKQDTGELSSKINRILKSSKHAHTKVDKGMAMVVMDRREYFNKAQNIKEQPTYRPPHDPTNMPKAR